MRDDDLRHWDHARVHDDRPDADYDRDTLLDRVTGCGLILVFVFGVWKILELGAAGFRWLVAAP